MFIWVLCLSQSILIVDSLLFYISARIHCHSEFNSRQQQAVATNFELLYILLASLTITHHRKIQNARNDLTQISTFQKKNYPLWSELTCSRSHSDMLKVVELPHIAHRNHIFSLFLPLTKTLPLWASLIKKRTEHRVFLTHAQLGPADSAFFLDQPSHVFNALLLLICQNEPSTSSCSFPCPLLNSCTSTNHPDWNRLLLISQINSICSYLVWNRPGGAYSLIGTG